MADIVTVLQNLTPDGIVGIALIFIAVFLFVSVCSLAITKYTNSRKNVINQKDKTIKSNFIKEKLYTE